MANEAKAPRRRPADVARYRYTLNGADVDPLALHQIKCGALYRALHRHREALAKTNRAEFGHARKQNKDDGIDNGKKDNDKRGDDKKDIDPKDNDEKDRQAPAATGDTQVHMSEDDGWAIVAQLGWTTRSDKIISEQDAIAAFDGIQIPGYPRFNKSERADVLKQWMYLLADRLTARAPSLRNDVEGALQLVALGRDACNNAAESESLRDYFMKERQDVNIAAKIGPR